MTLMIAISYLDRKAVRRAAIPYLVGRRRVCIGAPLPASGRSEKLEQSAGKLLAPARIKRPHLDFDSGRRSKNKTGSVR